LECRFHDDVVSRIPYYRVVYNNSTFLQGACAYNNVVNSSRRKCILLEMLGGGERISNDDRIDDCSRFAYNILNMGQYRRNIQSVS